MRAIARVQAALPSSHNVESEPYVFAMVLRAEIVGDGGCSLNEKMHNRITPKMGNKLPKSWK